MILFRELIERLKFELMQSLPGEEAQFVMAPYLKDLRKSAFSANPDPRLSAVLILLYPLKNKPHTLLILRNTYNGVHSAQVSFPGGRMDKEDGSLQITALRETEEEVGIPKEKVTVIGKLSQVYIPPSRFLVQPFIGYLNHPAEPVPDPKEVCALIETPLQMIIDEKTVEFKDIRLSDGLIMQNTPYFNIYGHTVWGATAMMLGELKVLLKKIMP